VGLEDVLLSDWTVDFAELPASASWKHCGLREGFEVAFFSHTAESLRIEGTTSGLQDGDGWIVSYVLDLDRMWRTRAASVTSTTVSGSTELALESDHKGRWLIDGRALRGFDGCLDVDLESSALTNAFPVHRLGMKVGETTPSPAVYIRASTLEVQLLEQTYSRVGDVDGAQQFDYEAPAFNFSCRLSYDRSGLVLEYPGIAIRSG
jgi:hypothetical protein